MVGPHQGLVLPPIAFGERFRVRSRAGTQYVVRYLGQGEGGIFVRLDDQRIARLDDSRLEWSTFARASGDGAALAPGDDIVVDLEGSHVRGRLETLRPLSVRTSLEVIPIARERVRALHLLFRARELLPGDRFLVRGRSGTEYDGSVSGIDKEHVVVTLRGGRETTLQRRRLDMDTLLVMIPVPLDRL
jgi:hypothetical protein